MHAQADVQQTVLQVVPFFLKVSNIGQKACGVSVYGSAHICLQICALCQALRCWYLRNAEAI